MSGPHTQSRRSDHHGAGPSAGRLARHLLLASLLACATFSSLTLLGATGASLGGRGGAVAQAAPQDTASPTVTTTITTTATTTATPATSDATLTLVSPASAQGPVGAHLTLSGRHWSGTQVSLAAATTSCASPAGSLGQAKIWAGGSFTTTIDWPATLAVSGTAYLLCATDDGGSSATAAQIYRVRSASPPALSVSLSQAAVGQEVHIEGSNFIGVSSVTVMVQTPKGQRPLATLAPDLKDGSFVHNYIPVRIDMGTVTLTASSAPDGSAPPALQATASLTIGPPLAPTATVFTTAVPDSTPTIVFAQSSGGALDSLGLVVLLAVGGLLLLLALVGVAAWLMLRARQPRYTPAPRPATAMRQTARVPAGVGVRPSGARQRIWADDLDDLDAPDESSFAARSGSGPRPLTLGDLVRIQRAGIDGGSQRHPDGYATGYATGYGDGAGWAGSPAVDEGPTAADERAYFGLPPLEEPDPLDHAATHPTGPRRREAYK